jgi:hypothetical protein
MRPPARGAGALLCWLSSAASCSNRHGAQRPHVCGGGEQGGAGGGRAGALPAGAHVAAHVLRLVDQAWLQRPGGGGHGQRACSSPYVWPCMPVPLLRIAAWLCSQGTEIGTRTESAWAGSAGQGSSSCCSVQAAVQLRCIATWAELVLAGLCRRCSQGAAKRCHLLGWRGRRGGAEEEEEQEGAGGTVGSCCGTTASS